MTTTTNPRSKAKLRTKGAGKETGGLLAIAGAACIACCIGPIMAFLGGVTILGVASSTVIGAGGLMVAAMSIVAAVVVLRRRRGASCATSTGAEPVPVELRTSDLKLPASR